MGVSRTTLLILLAALPALARAAAQHEAEHTAANPIRKVVTMLQAMQKKVTEEGEKEKELYEKFMCYCKKSDGSLAESITAAETKVPVVTSDITTAEELKAQTGEDLSTAQSDRTAAKGAMATATAIREKEAAAFAAEKAEYDANIAALKKAVAAIEKGIEGSFLQTSAADTLRKLALATQDIAGEDRQELLAFLSAGQGDAEGYAPQSGQIVGILKEIGDVMEKALADATAAETGAIKDYEALLAAKEKEVGALTESIETKTKKVGELAVDIAMKKDDLTDTQAALAEDQQFAADLGASCKTKTGEWEERSATRKDELATLADTIKVLNDDDALDLFKSTLPSGSSSFVQFGARSARTQRARARVVLQALRPAHPKERAQLDFIMLALRGKKIGFEKIAKMIDDLVVVLKNEQVDDDNKKEYCGLQLDQSDDTKKGLERSVADHEAAISTAKEGIAAVEEEIAALEASIKALDKSVAEATGQRKEEHEDFAALIASNSAAKKLVAFAKNRLNKFYNPKLYKAPPPRKLTEEERIYSNLGGSLTTTTPGGIADTGIAVLAEVSAHKQLARGLAAPEPPPETWTGYTKKSQENTGVIAMMDLLIKDLEKEMTEGEQAEKDAQADYETMMTDSAKKRTADSKSLTEKGEMKASLDGDLQASSSTKASTSKQLMATLEYIQSLHGECDWLLKYYDTRKEARSGEMDSLASAKAALLGADYALVQTKRRSSAGGFLQRHVSA